jgi:pilus assembly protein TadC
MLAGLAIVASVGFAGLAGLGFVRAPADRLHRIDSVPSAVRRLQLPGVLRGRPDAIAFRLRGVAGMGAGLAIVLLVSVMTRSTGPAVWLAGALGAAVAIYALGKAESPAARRRRDQMVIDLPHVLELLAAAMEAGLPLRNATREVVSITDGPLTDDLQELLASIDLGRSDADAWRSRRAHPVLDRVALDLARSCDSGTMIVSSLRHHAEAARRNRRGALEARAKTVGVKSVPPLVVCFVPAFLLIGIVPTGAALFMSFLS